LATATAISGGIGAATSVANFFEGRSMKKKGERFAENFEWEDLTNPYKTQQVSTLGSDLKTEQQQVGEATAVDALQAGGTRALVGGLGQVQSNANLTNTQIAANLDEQQKKIDFAASGQDVRNQAMMEKRQGDELAGYGNMMNTGLGMQQGAVGDFISSAGVIGQGAEGGAFEGDPNKKAARKAKRK